MSEKIVPRIRPTTVLVEQTKQVRVNRFNWFASTSIAAVIFIVLLIPILGLAIWVVRLLWDIETLIGSNILSALAISVVGLTTYFLARCVFSLFRYRLIAVPITACDQCHYDLKANVSGVCPECGTPIERAPELQPQANPKLARMVAVVAILAGLGAVGFAFSPWGFVMWFAAPGPGTVMATPQVQGINDAAGKAVSDLDRRPTTDGISGTVVLGKNDSANDFRTDQSLENCVVFLNDLGLRNTDIGDDTMPVLSISAKGFSPKHLCVRWNKEMGLQETSNQNQQLVMIDRMLLMRQINLQPGELQNTKNFPPNRFVEVYNSGVGGQVNARNSGPDTAYLHVFSNPFHSLTDAQGAFNIPLPPPGTYELICEHLEHGRLSTTITVADSDTGLVVDFIYDDWQALNPNAAP